MKNGQTVVAAPLAWGFTRTTGPKQSVALQVEFLVTRGPDEGSTITGKFWFTPAAIERTREQLEHMGWAGGAIATSNGRCAIRLNPRREVKVSVEAEMYQGREYLKAGFVRPLFRGDVFEGEDLKRLSDELATTVEGFAPRERKAEPVPQHTESETTPGDGDFDFPPDPGRDAKGAA
jgi:hypothetical protein